jgi:hypothetical protein
MSTWAANPERAAANPCVRDEVPSLGRMIGSGARPILITAADLNCMPNIAALPEPLVHLVLHCVPARDRSVRLTHALVCRAWQSIVRADESLHVHISVSPKASALPAVLPSFIHDDALSCRMRIGVTFEGLPRLASRLARAVEMSLLAHRSSVATASIRSLRLEDFKSELPRVLPGLLFHTASLVTLAAPRVRSAMLLEVHLVRCALPPNLLTMLAHVVKLRVWDCVVPSSSRELFLALQASTRLRELAWGVWSTEPASADYQAASMLMEHLPSGLERLAVRRPLSAAPPETWARVAPTLKELTLADVLFFDDSGSVSDDVTLQCVIAALPSLRTLHTLHLPLHFCADATLLELLRSAPPQLTSLGQVDCKWDHVDPVAWLRALPASVRLHTLSLNVNSPDAALQLGQLPWACEAGGASIYACALQVSEPVHRTVRPSATVHRFDSHLRRSRRCSHRSACRARPRRMHAVPRARLHRLS